MLFCGVLLLALLAAREVSATNYPRSPVATARPGGGKQHACITHEDCWYPTTKQHGLACNFENNLCVTCGFAGTECQCIAGPGQFCCAKDEDCSFGNTGQYGLACNSDNGLCVVCGTAGTHCSVCEETYACTTDEHCSYAYTRQHGLACNPENSRCVVCGTAGTTCPSCSPGKGEFCCASDADCRPSVTHKPQLACDSHRGKCVPCGTSGTVCPRCYKPHQICREEVVLHCDQLPPTKAPTPAPTEAPTTDAPTNPPHPHPTPSPTQTPTPYPTPHPTLSPTPSPPHPTPSSTPYPPNPTPTPSSTPYPPHPTPTPSHPPSGDCKCDPYIVSDIPDDRGDWNDYCQALVEEFYADGSEEVPGWAASSYSDVANKCSLCLNTYAQVLRQGVDESEAQMFLGDCLGCIRFAVCGRRDGDDRKGNWPAAWRIAMADKCATTPDTRFQNRPGQPGKRFNVECICEILEYWPKEKVPHEENLGVPISYQDGLCASVQCREQAQCVVAEVTRADDYPSLLCRLASDSPGQVRDDSGELLAYDDWLWTEGARGQVTRQGRAEYCKHDPHLCGSHC